MSIVWRWGFDKLVKTIVAILLNKYDVFLVSSGNTGIGKSSFALHLAYKVRREFRKLKSLDYETVKYYYEKLKFEQKGISEECFIKILIQYKEEKAYEFRMSEHLIYRKEDMQKFLNGWHGIGIGDEAINVYFNRDFYSEEQKNIVKMVNMYRDHNNLVIACVPNFNVLDNQIKNLCKIRIDVVRRGVAIIQTPNKTMYSKDKWDSDFNQKVEREWLTEKSKKPEYSKLTTFRGIVCFPKLPDNIEEKYQKIKNTKRNIILKNDMGIEIENKELSSEDKLYNRLISGGIKNMQIVEGIAMANDISLEQMRAKIRRKLELEGKNTALSSYFWDKKALAKDDSDKEFKDKLESLKQKL